MNFRLDSALASRRSYHELVRLYRLYTLGYKAGVIAYLNDDQLAMFQRNPQYSLNVCPKILNAKVGRLAIDGWQVSTVEADDEEYNARMGDLLMEWLEANEAKQLANDVHFGASRDGDSFAIVEWDEVKNRPMINFEPVYDGYAGTKMVYQDSQAVYAVKVWQVCALEDVTKIEMDRKNVYYPDRVERYYSPHTDNPLNQAWLPYEADGLPSVIPHIDSAGKPLGIAVFHFSNNCQGQDVGTSDLADVVPSLQDTLNMVGVSALMGTIFAGFPLNYIFGDLTFPENYSATPGALFTANNASGSSVTVGQFPPANIPQLIDSKIAVLLDISEITSVPFSMLQTKSQVAAEGTLQQMEAPLLAKVEQAQRDFGQTWEFMAEYMLRLDNTFNEASEVLDGYTHSVKVRWANPQTRNELIDAQTLQIHKALGVPDEIIWEKLGYDQNDIERMKQMKNDETATQAVSVLREIANVRQPNGRGVAQMEGERPSQGQPPNFS